MLIWDTNQDLEGLRRGYLNNHDYKKIIPRRPKEFFETKMTFTHGADRDGADDPNNEVNVVDVRAAEYYAEGHIPGAVDVPKDPGGRRWKAFVGTI